jgi:ATP-dependent RNA helicase DeaD
MSNTKFSDYSISEEILKAIQLLDYQEPTRVQQEVIPLILEKKDVVVKSQTGSGKTASFAIPICELVDWEENKPQALVLVPTRELALQVKEEIFNLGRFKRLKVPVVFGKTPIDFQIKELKQKSHVVVATPGRLIDLLEQGNMDTSCIRYLIIDEADEMLNMGFVEDIETIIGYLPKERTTCLLSATFPNDIEKLCNQYMKSPEQITIEEKVPTIERIEQEKYFVDDQDKERLLRALTIVNNPDTCILFCNTKDQVDELHALLVRLRYSCHKLHGGMKQSERTQIIRDFKQGYFRYLIATDVAARGIDIEDISLVINYDIPRDPESYVHRIGRTGRKDRDGKAISFVSKAETLWMKAIERYIDKTIEEKTAPSDKMVAEGKEAFESKMKRNPELKETKGSALNEGILKLHINAGKKTKMRPADVVGTLCNIEGVTADDIGIISVQDISTFVEILNNKGEHVFKALQKMNIKGRPRRVSKVAIDR